MITYFKNKNKKSKKRFRKYNLLTTILKSFDTLVVIGTTTSSLTLSFTGVGFIAIPISSGIACGLTISDKVLYEIITNKYKKKLYERDQQTNKSFDNFYGKSSQDNIIDKNE